MRTPFLPKPPARLVPANADDSHEDLRSSFGRFRQIREKAVLSPPGLPKLTVRELVEEGRC